MPSKAEGEFIVIFHRADAGFGQRYERSARISWLKSPRRMTITRLASIFAFAACKSMMI
jgi:hypothetical protein